MMQRSKRVFSVKLMQIWVGAWLYGLCAGSLLGNPIILWLDEARPQGQFAAEEITAALQARGYSVERRGLPSLLMTQQMPCLIVGQDGPPPQLNQRSPARDLKPEAFSLRVLTQGGQTRYWVIGADAAGLMYGGLELAEVIRIKDLRGIQNDDQTPYMSLRGTKFNCPLDVRTPSYTDVCDAGQKNIGQMWSFEFWKAYIDSLARYRYNYISLWNLHPFPSMVQVPDYPKVALADVQRSTVQWKEHYSLEGHGFCDPEIINQVEVLKEMTIDDKIAFWRRVMRYGKARNVDLYVVTWNIFVYGTNGQYGITDEIDNETTRDYFRKSVKQMFVTYPDLKGIGLTTGENMSGASVEQKEDWALATYGQGVLDAAKEFPGRKITFVHRQHQTGALGIADTFKPIIDHPDIEFIFSFKYAKAHVYSATTQPYHPGFVKDIESRGNLKTLWTLRNDDIFHFRWGAPDFVREFIQNIPYDVSRGYYYGSDQYIWGREFMSTEPENPRQIEINKHWYHWLLWGRLGYDPTLSNERLEGILQARFPDVSARKLQTAWQEASMIYPEVTGFHWGALDFQWYIESSQSRPGPAATPTGFHDINRFISLKPHAASGYVSIPDYVKAVTSSQTPKGVTPIVLSDQIKAHADKALDLIGQLQSGDSKELRLTLQDIRSMAYLGKYYAHKIRAATELALFRETSKPGHQDMAIAQMRQAALYWRYYAGNALTQYTNPLWTNRVGYVDWRDTMTHVLYDLTMLGADHTLPSMQPTPGGTILQAREATKRSDDRSMAWTYEAPKGGIYLLELRYTLTRSGRQKASWTINDQDARDMELWKVSDRETWVWDRIVVSLDAGKNTLRLRLPSNAQIDHLNILYGGQPRSLDPRIELPQIKDVSRADLFIRDPFIVPDAATQTYTLYKSSNVTLKNDEQRPGVVTYTSKDLQTWRGPLPVFIYPDGLWADGGIWAPEVHKHRGRYYMFSTFNSNKPVPMPEGRPQSGLRATQICVADSPLRPFKIFENKPHTPEDWLSLDGTLWEEDVRHLITGRLQKAL